MVAVCRRSESRRLVAGWRISSTTKKRAPVRKPATARARARASQENLLDGRKEKPHDLASVYVESTLYTIAAYAFGTIKKHSELRMLVM